MKTQSYKEGNIYIQLHKSKEGPKETFVLHHKMTARIFLGAAGLINYLNGKITEKQLQGVELWINSLDEPIAA